MEVIEVRVRRDNERDLVIAIAAAAASVAVDRRQPVRLRTGVNACTVDWGGVFVSCRASRLRERVRSNVGAVVVAIVIELNAVVVIPGGWVVRWYATADPGDEPLNDPDDPAHRAAATEHVR